MFNNSLIYIHLHNYQFLYNKFKLINNIERNKYTHKEKQTILLMMLHIILYIIYY